MASKGWIGVDLDGTLAHYDEWRGPTHIGAPIKKMVDRVKKWLAEGHDVRIFTARVNSDDADKAIIAIVDWCHKVFGHSLPVTCMKDMGMIALYDDRAYEVIPNTGILRNGL